MKIINFLSVLKYDDVDLDYYSGIFLKFLCSNTLKQSFMARD